MNFAELHEKAMNFSFLAKQEREKGDEDKALDFYSQAAEIEGSVADYYLDKSDLEPTRSIIIRSAAFLNLKAGSIERGEKYVFWGLTNTDDPLIKEQFYDALELYVSFRNLTSKEASGNVDYLYKLRQKSVYYSIEPVSPVFSKAVTLEMISDFSTNYTKSLKAFSFSKYKRTFADKYNSLNDQEEDADKFQNMINPVLTGAGFGSFKFAIAADFLSRLGEQEDITKLKSNILLKYHDEIFSKDLSEENITKFKNEYTNDEIDQIFRPVLNIKSNKSEYTVSYIDRESLRKSYVSKVKNSQKSKLLPIKKVNPDDIGKLENIITHTRSIKEGVSSRNIILKQELKSYSFDFPTRIIEPKGMAPIILSQEMRVNIDFNSEVGFTFSYEDLPIETSAIVYNDGLNDFYVKFIDLVKYLATKHDKSVIEEQYWIVIKKLLENPENI